MNIRHSVTLTLLIAASAAVIVIPNQSEEAFTAFDARRIRLAYVGQRFAMQSELYRREHSRALARAAVLHLPPDTSRLVVIRPPDVPPALEQRVMPLAKRGEAGLPRHDPSMRVVYVLTVDTGSTLAGVPVLKRDAREWSSDVFPPGAVGPGVCVEVVRAHNVRALAPPKKYDNGAPWWWEPLGPCWWYATYGTPGKGVATWLDSTHYAPIHQRGQYLMNYWDWTSEEERRPFFYTWTPGRESDGAMTACAGGRAEYCRKVALSNIPESSNEWLTTPSWIGLGRDWSIGSNDHAARLLRRLQATLGPEEFEILWKSDEAIPDAFHTVHGGSFDAWVRDAIHQFVPDNREHPLPSWTTLASLVAGAIGLLWLGTRAVSRRSGFA